MSPEPVDAAVARGRGQRWCVGLSSGLITEGRQTCVAPASSQLPLLPHLLMAQKSMELAATGWVGPGGVGGVRPGGPRARAPPVSSSISPLLRPLQHCTWNSGPHVLGKGSATALTLAHLMDLRLGGWAPRDLA